MRRLDRVSEVGVEVALVDVDRRAGRHRSGDMGDGILVSLK